MVCQNCYKIVDDRSEVCNHCGAKIDGAGQPQTVGKKVVKNRPAKKSRTGLVAVFAAFGGFGCAVILMVVLAIVVGVIAVGILIGVNQQTKQVEHNKETIANDANELPTDSHTEPDREYTFLVPVEYGVLCYHIPVVELPDVQASAINQQMYDTHYAHLEEMVLGREIEPFMLEMVYSVMQKGDIVSVMVQEACDTDYTQYYVYNFSASTGEQISDTELFAAFGMTELDGRKQIRDSLTQYWDNLYEELGNGYFDSYTYLQREKTIAADNVDACRPFIDQNGNLRYVGSIYSLGGADSYDWIFDDMGNAWRVECSEH